MTKGVKMDISDVTIAMTYYCVGEIRRNYLKLCLESILGANNPHNIPILVIDGSPRDEAEINKEIFKPHQNVQYHFNEEKNPYKRCLSYFKLIKTPYVFRVIEDIVLLSFKDVIKETLLNDLNLLEECSDIRAVYYPNITEASFRLEGNNFFYKPINFMEKPLEKHNGYYFYDLIHDKHSFYPFKWLTKLYNVNACSCNNFIYRTPFFNKHWEYLYKNYNSFADAESNTFNSPLGTLLRKTKPTRFLSRFVQKLIHGKFLLNRIAVTESIKKVHAIHLGFYSIEASYADEFDRFEKVDGIKGVGSINHSIDVIKDVKDLSALNFIPE